MVVVKFLVSVSEVELQYFQKFSPGLLVGQKDTFAPPAQLLGGACPGCPPKSTPMIVYPKLLMSGQLDCALLDVSCRSSSDNFHCIAIYYSVGLLSCTILRKTAIISLKYTTIHN